LTWFINTVGGLWQMLRLFALMRLRFGGGYWQWRMQTAFGRGRPGRGEMMRAGLLYARWMHRMRSGG
jgi:hypothetical protein